MSYVAKKHKNKLHSPPATVTAGAPSVRYRVRDKDWAVIWGEDLTFDEAIRLKNTVCGHRKSISARLEDMTIEPPEHLIAAAAAARANYAAMNGAPSSPVPVDPQLAALQAPARAAASKAAADADRRAKAVRERDLAIARAKRLAAEAEALEQETDAEQEQSAMAAGVIDPVETEDDVDAMADEEVMDLLAGADDVADSDIRRAREAAKDDPPAPAEA